MTRLSRLLEQQLEETITSLEQQLTELRAGATQYIGGASIKFYTSSTSATWDWTGLLNDPSHTGAGGKLFQITAVAINSTVFWGQAYLRLYADTSTNYYDGLAYITDYKNNNSPFGTTFTDVPNSSPAPNTKSWYLQLSGNSTRTLWVKFYVQGIDTANVTVTALS